MRFVERDLVCGTKVTEMATKLITALHELAPKPSPTATRLATVLPVAARRNDLFSETLLEMSSTRPQRRTEDLVISVVFHAAVLLALVLPSLYFTDTIDLKRFAQTLLVAPPPPPPPAPIAQSSAKTVPAPRRVFMSEGKLLAPTSIPQKVAMLKEQTLEPDIASAGGIPGGVPGGQMGGVIGGVISGSRAYIPAPVSNVPQPRAPVRVGGHVKPPKPLVQRAPVYPILARQAHLQGTVSIDSVIDSTGNVVEMQVVSGPPLLIQAALDAVREWKYEPTYLNDQAVPVRLVVTVVFRLSE
jgi:periplasmic protein TonB